MQEEWGKCSEKVIMQNLRNPKSGEKVSSLRYISLSVILSDEVFALMYF